MNELTSNAFKYALSNSGDGSLQLTLKEEYTGSFKMTVKDSGPGLPTLYDINTITSLGLGLVKKLSKQLCGA